MTEVDGIDFVICLECGKRMKEVTYSHLKGPYCGGDCKTVTEYRKKYPNVSTICTGLRKAMSVQQKAWDRKWFVGKKRDKYKRAEKHKLKCFECELVNKIDVTHSNCVKVYRIGNSYIKLCWFCANRYGMLSGNMNILGIKGNLEDTNGRDVLFEYVKNNHIPDVNMSLFTRGCYYSRKNDILIWHQSLLEKVHIYQMEHNPNIVKYKRGPRINYIDYNNGNKIRPYLIDWEVLYKDGSKKLVESKPMYLLKVGLDNIFGQSIIPKLEAAEEYAKVNGYTFEYWTSYKSKMY